MNDRCQLDRSVQSNLNTTSPYTHKWHHISNKVYGTVDLTVRPSVQLFFDAIRWMVVVSEVCRPSSYIRQISAFLVTEL